MKSVSPATPLKKITTTSSHVTHLRLELKFAPNLAGEGNVVISPAYDQGARRFCPGSRLP